MFLHINQQNNGGKNGYNGKTMWNIDMEEQVYGNSIVISWLNENGGDDSASTFLVCA